MIRARPLRPGTARAAVHLPARAGRLGIGTAGQAAILAWSLATVVLVPASRMVWACALCLAADVAAYPLSWRRLVRPRWLLLLLVLAVPPLLITASAAGEGPGFSAAGVRAALDMLLRLVVVLVAVDGFTNSVEVTALAGLFEGIGLPGLGFALGVALNLLPALQSSAANAWRSLWMRGGLRRRPGRTARLLLVTIVCNALRRAEDIALAAEARAFSPERARPTAVQVGRADLLLTALIAIALVALCLLPS